MSREVIQIGSAPDDGTGDPLREGAIKINSNFQELYEGRMLRDFSNAIWDEPDGRYVMPEDINGVANQVNVIRPGDGTVTLGLPQDIHSDADVTFGSMVLQSGPIKSDNFVPGFTGGEGYRITRDGDGQMMNLSIIEALLVNELEVRKLRYSVGPRIDGPGGGKIETVTDNGDGTYDLTFPENPGITTDDFAIVQEFDPDNTQVVRHSRFDITAVDGKTLTAELLSGTPPQKGDDLAVVASQNSNRDSIIYYDPYLPGIDLLDGLSDFADWDARSPKIRVGLLDGLPDVAGQAPTGYGMRGQNIYLEDAVFEGTVYVTGGDAATESYASGEASSAESAAKSYTDGKVYRYPNNEYSVNDDYDVYSPQPEIARMVLTGTHDWPHGNGNVYTYHRASNSAKQVYYRANSNQVYERSWNGSSWTDLRRTEDTAGAQAKADAAEQAAEGYTDSLQSVLDDIFDEAVSDGTTVIVGGYLRNQFIQTDAILVGDLGDGDDYATEVFASGEASSAQSAAESYTDGRIFRYPTAEYDGGDGADQYSPKPEIAKMSVGGNDPTWPAGYGQVITYWRNSDTATQIFITHAGNRSWERSVDGGSYPNWSAWRETEDTAGAQAKADSALSAANGYTDTLQSTLDNIFDDAVQNGTTIITGGYLENQFIKTDAIVVGDLGDGDDYATQVYASGEASAAQSAAESYADEKVYNYSANEYSNADGFDQYSPKAEVSKMIVGGGASGWPYGYGVVYTYIRLSTQAKQVFYRSNSNQAWERHWNGSWTSWRETEDTAGAQSKANAAENAANGYTDTLQSLVESKVGEALTTGQTIIVGGYINADVVDMDLLLAEDAVISATLTMDGASAVIRLPVASDGTRGVFDEHGLTLPSVSDQALNFAYAATTGISDASIYTDEGDMHIHGHGHSSNVRSIDIVPNPSSFGYSLLRTEGVLKLGVDERTIGSSVGTIADIRESIIKLNVSGDPTITTLETEMPAEDGMVFFIENKRSSDSSVHFNATGNIATQNNDTIQLYEGSSTFVIYDEDTGRYHMKLDRT